VVRRDVRHYTWAQLAAEVRNPDSEHSARFSRLLTRARKMYEEANPRPAQPPAPRALVQDLDGRERPALIDHVARKPLAVAKRWEPIARVNVQRAEDGTWCAMLDVEGTKDFGITHECRDSGELARRLALALEWAFRKKRGGGGALSIRVDLSETPAPKKRAPRKPRVVRPSED
jgi:hypothetical protein